MTFLIDYQVQLIIGCFVMGVIGAVAVYRRRSEISWQIADLVWVVLGGVGALTAVLIGLYESDRTRIERQIDVAFVEANAFDRDAARFRLTWCDGRVPAAGAAGPAVTTLCDKVEFLSASTARNGELPLFIEVARIDAPLRSLWVIFGAPTVPGTDMDYAQMVEVAEAFQPAELLVFAAEDEATMAAEAQLRAIPGRAAIAAEFEVLARSYQELIDSVTTLKAEWEALQAGNLLLVIQVIALCLVAFAAPFRLGKSVAEIGGD